MTAFAAPSGLSAHKGSWRCLRCTGPACKVCEILTHGKTFPVLLLPPPLRKPEGPHRSAAQSLQRVHSRRNQLACLAECCTDNNLLFSVNKTNHPAVVWQRIQRYLLLYHQAMEQPLFPSGELFLYTVGSYFASDMGNYNATLLFSIMTITLFWSQNIICFSFLQYLILRHV